jgi:DNA-binding transcriptional MerR regulator
MLIGELAKKTGFSRDTIRYYEKIGLIQLGRKQRRENDYKEYPDYLVERLLFTQRLKNYGFTLSEIREMLELYDGDVLECDDMFEWVDQKLNQVTQKIKGLRSIYQKLSSLRAEAQRCKDNKCELPV